MRNKDTFFYRGKQAISVDFSAGKISSDGAIVLLEKLERKHKLIDYFSRLIPDSRHPLFITHSMKKLLKQRVFMLMHGYEDTNDVAHLKEDPLFQDILEGELASQPTLCRLENSLNKHSAFHVCYSWLDRYVSTIKKDRKRIVIDIDATDDPTHGHQQLSMFNGFYGQFMYNELFFHDGDTGQIIVPILRPGNSHSNKWYVAILKRVVKAIREQHPNVEIVVRADSGFSCAPFYKLASKYNLQFAVGVAANNVVKQKVSRVENAVRALYVDKKTKHQHFMNFSYQAGSWEQKQSCYAKVESTGKGLNTRFFVSNIKEKSGREIYLDFYVKRGEHSENRIKEVKNMCFSDRLSNHGFWANFFRLLLSSLAYEMFLLLKQAIRKTTFEQAKKWQIDTIRTLLLKVGATIKKTKRRIYYKLSSAFVHQDLLRALLVAD